MNFRSKILFTPLALALAVLVLFPRQATAQNGSWLGGSGSWDTGSNWNIGHPPASVAIFDSGSGTVTLTNESLVVLIFGVSEGGYTLSGGSLAMGGDIDMDLTGATGVIETINTPIVLNAEDVTFTNDTPDPTDVLYIGGSVTTTYVEELILSGSNTGANTIAGNISGYYTSLTKNGTGTWVLTGTNAFTAYYGISINAGVLQIGNGGTSGNLPNMPSFTNNATLVYDRSDTYTESNSITGTGLVVQNGAGTLVFTGDNSYSGGTIINSGTLQVGSGGVTGNLGSGGVTDNSALVYDLSNNITETNVITGSGMVGQIGVGSVALGANNTYTGSTAIDSGTIVVSALANAGIAGNLGASSNIAANLVFGGGALQFNGGFSDRLFTIGDANGNSATLVGIGSGSFTNTGAIAFANAAPHSLTLAGYNSGTNFFAPAIGDQSPGNPTSVNMTGSNTWVLTGTNTYSGLTTVSAGVLELNTTGAQSVGGNLTLNGGAVVLLQGNQINSSGSLAVNSGTFNISGNNQTLANVQLTSGVIAGTGGTLTGASDFAMQSGTVSADLAGTVGLAKTTSGTSMLSGINSYSGLTTVNGGELDLNATGGLSVNGSLTISNGYAKLLQANQINSSGNLVVNSGTFDIGANNQVLLTVQLNGGAIAGTSGTLTSANNYTIQSGTVSADLAGAVALTKTTSGTAMLSGANRYSGMTSINGGVLNVGGSGAFGGGGNITFGGGTLQYSASNTNDYSSLIVNSGAVISIDTNGQDVTYISPLAGSNTEGLTKLGSGTLVLAGANAYEGETSINGGVLNAGNSGAFGGGGNITFGGGTLQYSASNTNDYSGIIVSSTKAISIDTNGQGVTYSSPLAASNTGGLVKLGSGTLTLASVNNYTGTTTVSGGELDLNAPGGPAFAGNLTVNGGIAKLLQSNEINGSGSLSVSSGTFGIGGNNQMLANVQITGGVIAGTSGTLTSGNNYDIESGTVSANLGGSVGLAKTTGGTATLSGANSYSGVTNINGGVLNVGGSGAFGGGGNITFGGGTLQYSASNTNDYSSLIVNSGAVISIDTNGQDVTYTSPLAGSNTGGLTKLGSGTLVLAGANAYAGVTSINGGVLNAGNSRAFGGGGNITFGGGTLQYSASNTSDYSGIIVSSTKAISIDTNGQDVTYSSALAASNTGGLVKLGSGTLTLASVNNYTGTTTVSGGELDLNATGGPAFAGNLTVNGGIAKLLQSSEINSSGRLSVSSGTFDIEGNNQMLVLVQLSGGMIAGTSGTLSSLLPFAIQSGTVSANLGGGNSLTKSTSGTAVLSGTNSYSGGTTISGGALIIQNASINHPNANLSVGATANFVISSPSGIAVDLNGMVNGTGTSPAGTATVSSGSWINAGSLIVGQTGAGVLNLSGSGAITVGSGTGAVMLASGTGSVGTFNFGGGTLNVAAVTGGSGTATLNFVGSGSNTFAPLITGSLSVVQNGAGGTTVITGTEPYSGATIVKAGTLEIFQGGYINDQSGTNITVGKASGDNGTLLVNGGAVYSGTTLFTGGSASIGSGAGSSGTVMVSSGTFGLGNYGQLYVGLSGTGALNINGGYVNDSSARFGFNPGSVGTGVISGGTLNNVSYLVVGSGMPNAGGAGSVLVDGGYVSSGIIVIGDYAGSSGTLTITSGTLFSSGYLTVGNRSTGVFNLQGGYLTSYGGAIGNTDTSIPGSVSASSGTVNVTSGTWIEIGTNSLAIGSGSGTGVLNINGTGVVTVYAGQGQLLLTHGTLNFGGGTLTAGLVTSGSGAATVNFTTTSSSTFTPRITGAVVVNQNGAGTTILTGSNSYTGTTTISAGNLQIGNSGTTGSLGTGTVIDNAALVFDRSNGVTVANTITGSGALQQIGTGTVTLTGSSTYSGTTTVGAGTLTVNGASTSSPVMVNGGVLNGSGTTGNVTVNNGGMLRGTLDSGAVTANAGGTVSPGNSPGSDDMTSLTMSGSATYHAQIAVPASGSFAAGYPTPGTEYSQTTLTGTGGTGAQTVLTLDSVNSILELTVTGTLPPGGIATTGNPYNPNGSNDTLDNYFIITPSSFTGVVSGSFAEATDGTNLVNIDYSSSNLAGGLNGDGSFMLDGEDWIISYTGNEADNSTDGGNAVVLTAAQPPQPVPALPHPWMLMLAVGASGMAMLARQRKMPR